MAKPQINHDSKPSLQALFQNLGDDFDPGLPFGAVFGLMVQLIVNDGCLEFHGL